MKTLLERILMKIIKHTLSSLLAAAIVLTSFTGQASTYEPQKVVYHVNYDNAKRQAGALRNIQNHINAVGADKLDLRVVMHGKGLSLMLIPEEAQKTKLPSGNANEAMQGKIASLRSQGVTFKVCANTLRGKKISVDNLFDVMKEDVVPSGVAELAKLQTKGFTYLRP